MRSRGDARDAEIDVGYNLAEGCVLLRFDGDVYVLTPEEAERMAALLVEVARDARGSN